MIITTRNHFCAALPLIILLKSLKVPLHSRRKCSTVFLHLIIVFISHASEIDQWCLEDYFWTLLDYWKSLPCSQWKRYFLQLGSSQKACVLVYFIWNSTLLLRIFQTSDIFLPISLLRFTIYTRKFVVSVPLLVMKICNSKLFNLLIRKIVKRPALTLNVSPSKPLSISIRFKLVESASESNF